MNQRSDCAQISRSGTKRQGEKSRIRLAPCFASDTAVNLLQILQEQSIDTHSTAAMLLNPVLLALLASVAMAGMLHTQ